MANTTQTIYLDYLDFFTGDKRSNAQRLQEKSQRLKLDILASPNAIYLVAAPAIAKCPDTAYLLLQFHSLWASHRLRYVLDRKYQGDFKRYTQQRLELLQSTFDEQALANHFEYIGYTGAHADVFFNHFLTTTNKDTPPFFSRVSSADTAFRGTASVAISNASLLRYLKENGTNDPEQLARLVESKATSSSELFQRESIVRDIQASLKLNEKAMLISRDQFDKAFSRANAIAVGSTLPADIGGLSGTVLGTISRLIHISSRESLYGVLTTLSASQVVQLINQS
jgi:hypothetical protein